MIEKELGDLIQARLKTIKHKLNFDDMFFVPRIHRGRGLVLYSKESMGLRMETSSKNHINCVIKGGSEGAWRFTGFYGEPTTHK